MHKILLLCLLDFCFSINIYANETDTLILESCNRLFEEEQYEEASDCYAEHKNNVYAIYMIGRIAKETSDNLQLKKSVKKLTSRKIRTAESFHLAITLYPDDSDMQHYLINKGLKKFRHDTTLLVDLTNYSLENKDFPLATSTLKQLIKYSKSSHKSYYFALGYAYDMQKDLENAIANYDSAMRIDPNYLDPFYNAGVAYFNKGVEIYERANASPDNEEYNRLTEEAKSTLRMALPYFERANEISPNTEYILNALKSIYYRLDYQEAYNQINNQIREETIDEESWE